MVVRIEILLNASERFALHERLYSSARQAVRLHEAQVESRRWILQGCFMSDKRKWLLEFDIPSWAPELEKATTQYGPVSKFTSLCICYGIDTCKWTNPKCKILNESQWLRETTFVFRREPWDSLWKVRVPHWVAKGWDTTSEHTVLVVNAFELVIHLTNKILLVVIRYRYFLQKRMARIVHDGREWHGNAPSVKRTSYPHSGGLIN